MRRVPEFSPLQLAAHLVCAVAKATRIFTIREDAAVTDDYEKSPDTGGNERFRLIAFLKGSTRVNQIDKSGWI